ncbi:MAG: T9SS type A sorting domain-containing protein, partial [Candidatus Marinimicrobia bacterium]|nr:T9SS type A sorting domain-containing protein [Candidatus Neomarinimicrobiota bacterium]
SYKLTWDASDMPSGVYIVRMVAGDFVGTQKIILIK